MQRPRASAKFPDAATDSSLRALRVSESRYRRLFETARDGILLLNADTGQIEEVNPYLIEMLGYSHAEFLGKKLWEVGTFADIPQSKDMFHELQAKGYVRYDDLPLKTKAGARVQVEFVSNSYDCEGTKVIQCNIRDITERKRAEQALMQLRRQSELILKSIGEGIHGIDLEGTIIFENPAAAKLLGHGIKELSGKPAHATMHHSRKDGTPYPIAHSPIHATMHDGVARRVEDEVFWRKDGSNFPVEYTTAPIRGDRGDIAGVVVAFRDIADRKEAENRIKRLNRVYAVLSGINTLIVRVRDRDELFREACRIAFEHGRFPMAWIGVVDRTTMGVTPVASAGNTQDLLTVIIQRFSLSQGRAPENSLIARAIREKKVNFSNDVQNDPRIAFKEELAKRGSRSMAILPLQIADEVVGVLALFAEETGFFDEKELKLLTELADDIAFAIDNIEKQERSDYVAYYDVLTGLAKHKLFLERVAQCMRSAVGGGYKLALFLIDLERFKNINDSLGQPAGDALLRQVAEWLTRSTGNASLVARVGADHFAVVLPEVKQEGNVARLLEKTMEAFMEHPFRLNDAVFRIAAKAGVALFPDDGADANTLFRNAEAALKNAKASGDRYLFYTQNMTEAVAGKLTLENQLRQALDKEEFVLHYQPKVNLLSGKLTSVEALIRWNDPRTGLVPPGRFIPILEETGLIQDVGRWALRQALEDYLRWRNAGLPAVRIAVNVSPLQLRNRSFIDEIKQAIGIDANAAAGLELELTESLIMEDVKHSISSLQAIRAMGVTIAIDDFGTGFSSLSYLAKLPVDTLKIDRSFVIDMTAGPEGLALVSTIINLAHSLKLKVVAEGVETEEQSRLLRLLGCDEMQGFLFSKPVPSEIFETKFLVPPAAG